MFKHVIQDIYSSSLNFFLVNLALTHSQVLQEKGLHPFLHDDARHQVPEPKNILFLSNVPDSALSTLIGTAKTLTYIRAGSLGPEIKKATDCYIIFFGKAQALIGSGGNTREVMIDIRDSGTGNGEIAVLSNDLLLDSVVTLERVLFAVVSQVDFRAWQLESPEMKSALYKKNG